MDTDYGSTGINAKSHSGAGFEVFWGELANQSDAYNSSVDTVVEDNLGKPIQEPKCDASEMAVAGYQPLERVPNSFSSRAPWSATGRLVGFGEGPNNVWVASATLVTPRHVLTAAHCVYHPAYGGNHFAKRFTFEPARNARDKYGPFGRVNGRLLFVDSLYLDNPRQAGWQGLDWAIIELEKPIGDVASVVPALHLDERFLPKTAAIGGYPSAKDTDQREMWMTWNHCSVAKHDKAALYMHGEGSGGMSGGGLFAEVTNVPGLQPGTYLLGVYNSHAGEAMYFSRNNVRRIQQMRHYIGGAAMT